MNTLYSCTARTASRTSASTVAREQYRMPTSKRPSAPCTSASPGQHHAQLHHPVSTMTCCITCCRGAVQTVIVRSEQPSASCKVASPWEWKGRECKIGGQSHVSMAVSDLNSCMHGSSEGGSNISLARAQATVAGSDRAYRTRAY